MTTYCAPCLADLALVREAVTSVSGTAACVAHAVLLTHPGDTPQRRLTRLSELRAMAEGKLPTASAEDVPAIELLVQEYALAGAMDMTVPLKDLAGDRAPRPPKNRNRGRDRDRGRDRERGPRPEGGQESAPGESDAAAPSEGAPAEAPSVEAAPAPAPVEQPAPVEAAPAPAPESAPSTPAADSSGAE